MGAVKRVTASSVISTWLDYSSSSMSDLAVAGVMYMEPSFIDAWSHRFLVDFHASASECAFWPTSQDTLILLACGITQVDGCVCHSTGDVFRFVINKSAPCAALPCGDVVAITRASCGFVHTDIVDLNTLKTCTVLPKTNVMAISTPLLLNEDLSLTDTRAATQQCIMRMRAKPRPWRLQWEDPPPSSAWFIANDTVVTVASKFSVRSFDLRTGMEIAFLAVGENPYTGATFQEITLCRDSSVLVVTESILEDWHNLFCPVSLKELFVGEGVLANAFIFQSK